MGLLTDEERADVARALARIDPGVVFELRKIMPGWTSKPNEARRDFGMRFKADYDAGIDLGVVGQLKRGVNKWRYKKSGPGVEACPHTHMTAKHSPTLVLFMDIINQKLPRLA